MRFLILVIFSILLYASNIDDIIKSIPKNSPNYSLATILAQKIKTLNYQPPKINLNPTNQKEYLQSFYQLNDMLILQNSLPEKINDIEDKISVLQNQKDPISQLQLLYYEKLLKIDNQTLNFLNNNFSGFEKKLHAKLNDIQFDIQNAKKEINKWQKKLQDNLKQLEKLKIDLQKFILLNDQKSINKTQDLIEKTLNNQKEIYKNLLNNQLILWFNDLQHKNKHAFNTDDDILKYAKEIDNNFYTAINQLVTDFEQLTFGAKVLVYGAKKEAELLWQKVLHFINYPLFTVGNRTITPLNFAIFVIVLIIGWFVGKYYKHLIYKIRHKYKISHSTATLLANMGYYTIITLSFLIALKVVGLDLSSLAIIAGALSVGIGFGLQNVVSNFVSGIILMFERSIKVGDYIEIDQDTRGEVIDISMRSTIIRTNDNINLIIPNQSFIQNNVINWTLGDDIVRFRVPFGVAYGSDIDKVEKVILQALEKSNLPYIKKHPSLDVKPLVVFMEMADSSLNFELFVWVKGEYARRPRRTRSKFLKMIYNALNEAGITIPFPQQDLHIKDTVPFEITIKR
ncbi:MAG: mechanosensitive ion channel [Epsilonproteobacteria bacterium]|nr:mechanosensitive ion channel [Campylobacterota bacterium]